MEAPAGFEEILIGSNDANALLLEGIDDCTKDLAIISAPGEFDPESLVGETIVLNGSRELDPLGPLTISSNEKRYVLHGSSVVIGQHGVTLFPSSDQKKYVTGPCIVNQLNVVESLHVPGIVYPSAERTVKEIVPKPKNLRRRYKPFGYGQPAKSNGITGEHQPLDARPSEKPRSTLVRLHQSKVRSNGSSSSDEENQRARPKTVESKRQVDPLRPSTESNINVTHKKRKRKKERITEEVSSESTQIPIHSEPTTVPENSEVQLAIPKKKKKKKSKDSANIIESTDSTNIKSDTNVDESQPARKKKKKNKENECLESNASITSIKIEEEIQQQGLSKKKKKKKKHSESCNPIETLVEKESASDDNEIAERKKSTDISGFPPLDSNTSIEHKKKKKKRKHDNTKVNCLDEHTNVKKKI